MQTIDQSAMSGQQGSITAETFDLISRTTGWMKFLSIMGFIGSGLVLLGSFAVLAQPYAGPALFVVYFIIGIIGFFPAIFLMQYANRLGDFCENRDGGSLQEAFSRQRVLFMFMGILTIVYLVLMLIGLVVGVAAASRMY